MQVTILIKEANGTFAPVAIDADLSQSPEVRRFNYDSILKVLAEGNREWAASADSVGVDPVFDELLRQYGKYA